MPASVAPPLLRIEAVRKTFGNATAVDEISLDVRSGEFFSLLGPSGCGKTTLLRMLAGFETPDTGRILLDGVDIAQILPHQRNVNMMFQNYALFPHLDVRSNIAFGLKRADLPRKVIADRVAEMVALVKLEGFERRKPDQLSGGQKQRVALARALARTPQILLLDEPLGALDKRLREQTQAELMALQRRLGTTFIVVTHDQEEAMTMADRIGVMNAGKLVQVSPPRQLYEAPVSRWVAEFVGDVNILEGQLAAHTDHRVMVSVEGVGEIIAVLPRQPVSSRNVCVAIRPEKIRLSRTGPVSSGNGSDRYNCINGVVDAVNYLGGSSVYTIRLKSGRMLRASLANTARLETDAFAQGEEVVVWFMPDDCVVLPQ